MYQTKKNTGAASGTPEASSDSEALSQHTHSLDLRDIWCDRDQRLQKDHLGEEKEMIGC